MNSNTLVSEIETKSRTNHIKKFSKYLYSFLLLNLLMVFVLFFMGRNLAHRYNDNGSLTYDIKLWHGAVSSPETSQQFADPYSFTHLIHGIIFAWILKYAISKKFKLSNITQFTIALSIEALWEVVENTPFAIERYRTATIAQNYYGDTILNSVGDMFFMAFGYIIAMNSIFLVSLILFVIIETILALAIRDNLTLNVLMLIKPIQSIKDWQTKL